MSPTISPFEFIAAGRREEKPGSGGMSVRLPEVPCGVAGFHRNASVLQSTPASQVVCPTIDPSSEIAAAAAQAPSCVETTTGSGVNVPVLPLAANGVNKTSLSSG